MVKKKQTSHTQSFGLPIVSDGKCKKKRFDHPYKNEKITFQMVNLN